MHKETHPNHHQLSLPEPVRNKRNTIMKYKPNLEQHLQGSSNISNDEYKQMNKAIHTESVRETILSYNTNKVLNERPPEINESESQLPRKSRTTLAQLRSSYSPFLNTYLHRINRAENPLCPNCNAEEHTTCHLFNCQQKPTNLTEKDLWDKPKQVAEFLHLPMNEELEDPG